MNNVYLNLFHKSGHENPYDDFVWRMEGSGEEAPAFCPKCHRALTPCVDYDHDRSEVDCTACGVVYQVFPGNAIFNRPFEAIMLMTGEDPVSESDLKVCDALIGMDIISMGDMKITNKPTTKFIFRIPAEGDTPLVAS